MSTKEQISHNMSRVRSSGIVIEKKLGKALWAAGVRYRMQYKKLIGRPDFVVVCARIAIVCDSSFWHGRAWPSVKKSLKSNSALWTQKIESNIARDAEVNLALANAGWKVFRFWDKDINASAHECAVMIVEAISERKANGAELQSHSS